MNTLLKTTFAFILLVSATIVSADEGHPVAVRSWPGGFVTIETFWGLSLSFDAKLPANHSGKFEVDQELLCKGEYEHILSRSPNAEKPTWSKTTEGQSDDSNGVRVTSRPLAADVPVSVTEIAVDGVKILFALASEIRGNAENVKPDDSIDLLVLSAADTDDLLEASVAEFVKKLGPTQTLINLEDVSPEDLDKFAKTIGAETRTVSHLSLIHI